MTAHPGAAHRFLTITIVSWVLGTAGGLSGCGPGPGGNDNGNDNDNSAPPLTVDDLPNPSADDALGQGEISDAFVPGLIFLGYDETIDAQSFSTFAAEDAAALGGQLLDVLPEINVASVVVPIGTENSSIIFALQQFEGLSFAEFNVAGVIAEATDALPDTTSTEFAQYQLFLTGGIQARVQGSPVNSTVAVLDTGCDLGHAEFSGAGLFAGLNYIDGGSNVSDDYPGGHGTAAVSLMLADGRGGEIVGLIPDAAVTVHKVCDRSGFCPLDAVVAGIIGALVGNADGDLVTSEIPAADVLSIGFSFEGQSEALARVIDLAVNSGVTIVAPAGNNGRSTFGRLDRYPAAFDGVISVGATDIRDDAAPFSNRAGSVDIAAPGVDLFVAAPGDGYTYCDGTSYAAAQIAATAAWLLDREILTPAGVLERLKSRGDALPAGSAFGAGVRRLNILAALADQDVGAEPYIIRDDALVAALGLDVPTVAVDASGNDAAANPGDSNAAEAFSGETVYLYGYFPPGVAFQLIDGSSRVNLSNPSLVPSTIDQFLTLVRGIELGTLSANFSIIQQAEVLIPDLEGQRRAVDIVASSGGVDSDPRPLIYNPLSRGYNVVAYKTFDSAVFHLLDEEGDAFDPAAANIRLLGNGARPEIDWDGGGSATTLQLGTSLAPDYFVVTEEGEAFFPPVRLGDCVGADAPERVCGDAIGLPENEIARVLIKRVGPTGAEEIATLDVIYLP